jgi:glycosyltransferase involved in cell wall biosynthesis
MTGRKLTIAMLHYAGPPTIGGVEATIAAHARVFAANGHHVRIIAGSAGPFDGAEVLLEPLLGSRGDEIARVNRQLAEGNAGDDFESLTARIVERLSQALAGVDVAIVHNVLTLHKNLAFTAALHRLHEAGLAPKLLAWCHDFAWGDPLYIPELHPDYPWKLLRTPWPRTTYVVVSADRHGQLAELLQIPLAQIAVVTPGIDLAAFLKLDRATLELLDQVELLEADPLLLLPARITRRKNIEQAIDIVAALRRRDLAPRLVVTGPPGPHNPANAAYLADLQRRRDHIGDDNAVVFLYERWVDEAGRPRPVSDAVMSDLFRLADGLLFPSRYEGFGIPILEAGLAGIPIFCSDIAPFRETAGDATLRFGHDEPADEVAGRIADALQADKRAALRRRVRLEFTWEAIYRRAIEPLLHDDA